jgi:hypothetical protein
MDVVRRATTMNQLTRGVPYRGKSTRIGSTSVLAELMAGPKRQWMAEVEKMAAEHYPAWRELFQKTGRRLPLEMRKELEDPPGKRSDLLS